MKALKILKQKKTIMKLGRWAFVFFLIKGLVWVIFAVIISKNI